MNKNEFMAYLEKRLSILNEKERQDIIAEYSQHIDMKIKQGMTETDAIKDFGNPKEFVDEILEAYNVDPEYEEELSHNDNLLNRFTGGIRKVSDFVFSQSPGVLMKMLIKILIVFGILFGVIFAGFMLIGTFFMSWLDLGFIGAVVLFVYLIVTVPIGFYVLCIYIKKLALSVNSKCGSGLLTDIGKGVNAFADFIITQKPSAIIGLLFKLFVMGCALFFVGIIGLIIPAIVSGVLSFFSEAEEVVFGLYGIVGVSVGLYVLWCYGKRLVQDMNRKVQKSVAKNEVESVPSTQKENAEEKKETVKAAGSGINNSHEDMFLASLGKGTKTLFHFLWKAIVLLFKLFVLGGVAIGAAMLIPVVVMTGVALVAMVTGYPAVGIFLICSGTSICGVSVLLLIIKAVFLRRVVYEENV